MPPKQRQQPESDSEESHGEGEGRALDFSRFTNPNYSREFLATLPAKVRDRTKVLMAMDDKHVQRCNDREKQMDDLRRKYEELYAPLYNRRRQIVAGEEEPTKEEILAGMPEDHKGKVTIDGEDKEDTDKGLPGFWLDVLQHHVIIQEMITERDEEVLEHLIDISVATLDPSVRPGFTVIFTFAPNEFFEETKLHKTFYWKHECGDLTIDTCDQSPITWKEGKNVTVTTVTQKQKSKKKGAVRYVTKTEPCESFFNFFAKSEDAEENEQWCSLAMTIREKMVPLAIEYYTGEAPDGSSDIDDGEEEDEEDDDDEEEEDEEEEVAPRGRGGRGGAQGGRGGAQAPAPARGKDCKQQ